MNKATPPSGELRSPHLYSKIMWLALIGVMVAIVGLTIGKWMGKGRGTLFRRLPVYGQLPDFELTESSGKSLSKKNLKGKVWIADFIFTRCAGPCPKMSLGMAQLQDLLKKEDDVRLVSFSVDPEFDTPEVLKEYAKRFHAKENRWFFLTGKREVIRPLAQESFKLTFEQDPNKPVNDPTAILHSTYFVLIDGHGRIRGYYAHLSEDVSELSSIDLLRITKDVSIVLWEQRALPTLNAVLNLSSVILLLLAYRAVRKNRLPLHRTLMFMAMATSAAFLTSYLIYHFGVQLTKPYEGHYRVLYYSILLSHTLLAVSVLPLVLVTVARALRAQKKDPSLASPEIRIYFEKHRVIAKWTFPIWLYVSFTGVIVYLMLYF